MPPRGKDQCVAPEMVKDCPGPRNEPAAKRCDVCQVTALLTLDTRDKLKKRRISITDVLKDAPNMKGGDVQKAWQGRVDAIVIGAFEAVFNDEEPCDYCLVMAGSGAREEACVFSDLDCFILTAKPQKPKANFFYDRSRAVAEIVGQADKWKGLRFCSIMSPMGAEDGHGPSLIMTPQEMAGVLDWGEETANDHVKNGLLESRYLSGEEKLLTEYKRHVTTFMNRWKLKPLDARPTLENRKKMGLERLKLAITNPDYELPKPFEYKGLAYNPGYFHIKNHFYRPIQFMIEGLAWYYNKFDSPKTLDQLEALQPDHMNKKVAALFQGVWDIFVKQRYLNQLEKEAENDYIVPEDGWSLKCRDAYLDMEKNKKWKNPKEKDEVSKLIQSKLPSARVDKKGFDLLLEAKPDLEALKRLAEKFIEEKTKRTLLHRGNPFLDARM